MTRTRSPRRSPGALLATAAFVLVLVLGAGAVAGWLRVTGTPAVVERCAALLDGTSWYLAPDQASNAALLSGIAGQRALPARAVTIAIATTLQESKLRNIDYGDRDSLGLFQQRPSQGWGTPEQVLDPVHATNAFYDALVRVGGYQDLPVTEAAQAVQRSAFPDAYGNHETRARAWASALTGHSPAALTCTLPDARAGDPTALTALAARDLGLTPVAEGAVVVLDATPLPGGVTEPTRLAWSVAHWAVSTAASTEAVEVRTADRTWSRETGAWTTSTTPVAPGTVEIVLGVG